jgi:hypothetical protein
MFCSSTRKKMPERQPTALCHPKRGRELAGRFEYGPAALCSQNSWPETCASVYTHTDIICWKKEKEREEEDNETVAQLKAFFLLFLFFYIQRPEAA